MLLSGLSAGGNTSQGELLLAWSRSFSTFDAFAQQRQLFGWTNATADIPCSWSGVSCSDSGLIYLGFLDDGTTPLHGTLSTQSLPCGVQALDAHVHGVEADG